MNKGICAILGFIVGGGLGVLLTRGYFEKKYERIADEEIESVKVAFSKKKERETNRKDDARIKAEKAKSKPEITKYSSIGKNLGYSSDESEGKVGKNRPQIISPDEFSDDEDCEAISLTYYEADKVLTDDRQGVMEDDEIENTVGLDAVNHFGEYEQDVVYVRNDRRETKYEILLDKRAYFDVARDMPYITED